MQIAASCLCSPCQRPFLGASLIPSRCPITCSAPAWSTCGAFASLCSQVLAVKPVQKVVTMRDSRKILSRTICIKLKGDFLAIDDVVVDKVGCCRGGCA